jgi:dinuclear metal center YbgI/SA1388 family protein
MVERDTLVRALDSLLDVDGWNDACPNGLQVEGCPEVRRIAVGVTACQELLERAAEWGADAVLVHHGIFWKSADGVRVRRSLKARLSLLLAQDISLLAYHLPLDGHEQFGNNAVLAQALGAVETEPAFELAGRPVGVSGRLAEPQSLETFVARLTGVLEGREPLVVGAGPQEIQRFGLVTGRSPRSIEEAVARGLDLFITGEPAEEVVHLAREEGIHFVAAGHHATERFGVRALAEHLESHFGVETRFFEVPNPV